MCDKDTLQDERDRDQALARRIRNGYQPPEPINCTLCGNVTIEDASNMTRGERAEAMERHWDLCSPSWRVVLGQVLCLDEEKYVI